MTSTATNTPQPPTPADAGTTTSATGGDTRRRVAVLFGGQSSEHSVSCVGAAAVIDAIDTDTYDVLPIGITKGGTWRRVNDLTDFTFEGGALPEVADNGDEIFVSPSSSGSGLLERTADGTLNSLGSIDVVFPVLHGLFGEDGTVQGLLELMGTAFVGAGVLTSATSMDKHYMKVVLQAAGIPVCPWVTVTAAQWTANAQAAQQRVDDQGYPAFVKPARAGSSVGISKVKEAADLPAAIALALEHDDKVIVEPAVDGREIECSVLGSRNSDPLRTSLPAEIIVGGAHEFYDFNAKYLDLEGARVECPAQIDAPTTQQVQEIARRTFRAFDCSGLARVDTFVTPQGEVLINELNTLPGFTPTSGYPLMFKTSGVEFADLIAELIEIGIADRA